MFLLEATRGILPERVPASHIALLAVWIILALPAVALSASPEIFLQEEPETYLVIDKLEGMGFLPGLMTGDRGLEAREVSREAEKAEGAGDPFVDGMLRFLRLGAARRHDFRLRAGLEHSGDGRVPPTRRVGRARRTGESARAAFSGRPPPTGFLSRRVATSLRDPRGATPGGSRRHPFAWAGRRQRWKGAAFPSGGGREGTGAFFSRPMPNR